MLPWRGEANKILPNGKIVGEVTKPYLAVYIGKNWVNTIVISYYHQCDHNIIFIFILFFIQDRNSTLI